MGGEKSRFIQELTPVIVISVTANERVEWRRVGRQNPRKSEFPHRMWELRENYSVTFHGSEVTTNKVNERKVTQNL